MLVPDSFRNALPDSPVTTRPGYEAASALPGASSDGSMWPGATTSGLTRPSYHVGPRELYRDSRSSPRSAVPSWSNAPTVMAEGALPGDVMPAYPTSPSAPAP